MTVIDKTSEWTQKQLENLKRASLFESERDLKSLEKIPHEFRFIWQDDDGAKHDHLVISWEIAEAWRRFRSLYDDPISRLREKIVSDLFGGNREKIVFMGNHSRFRETFMVCGWFTVEKGAATDAILFNET